MYDDTFAPIDLISSASVSRPSALTSTMHTFAPFLANSIAVALPIPTDAPVIIYGFIIKFHS